MNPFQRLARRTPCKKWGFLLLLIPRILLCPEELWAQERVLTVIVADSATGEPLPGTSVGVPGTAIGAIADERGRARLSPPPPAGAVLKITALGHTSVSFTFSGQAEVTLRLAGTTEAFEEEVVVTSTRTNSRLEDLPTRVEVLGEEEMQEENGIKPGNIASLLGDIAGTQIQPTSPTTGNADLRIQGLQGRYSQILRDGMPILGGYAGGFGILQVPPLDLKQAELIKGSSSTLYGGGAIAGLVNLVSKTPTLGKQEYSATLNQSTLRESNLNVFTSGRGKRFGYTFFAGGTRQRYVDVDGDGFSDVPTLNSLVVHPRFFVYPRIGGREGQLALGFTGTIDKRESGDVQVLKGSADEFHAYSVVNKTRRQTADLIYTQPLGAGVLTAKGVVSFFRREVSTNTVGYQADQVSHYSELSYMRPLGTKHTLVAGANFNGETLSPNGGTTPLQNGYTSATLGFFAQEVWKPGAGFTLELGYRVDILRTSTRNLPGGTARVAKSLPRIAILKTLGKGFSLRLNGGQGYRTATPYINELDERDLPRIQAYRIGTENSLGANGDLTWKHPLGEGVLTLSQGFFYTRLQNPVILTGSGQDSGGTTPLVWAGQDKPVISQGLESYARLTIDETEFYLGYQFTSARRLYDAEHPNVELAARHKLATVVVQEFNDHLGAGIEAAYTGTQYLSDGRRTPGYPIAAAMVRYRVGRFTAVLNAENLFDYRQTRKEAVITGNSLNPALSTLWAPVEGRVVNLSITWKLVRDVKR